MTPLEQAFKDLAHAEVKHPKWVINDLIPVGLTFLAGPPKKSYKSTLTIIKACLAARWHTQALPVWAYCELGGPTMMFSYEADEGEVLWVVKEGLGIEPQEGYVYIADDPWAFQLHDQDSGNTLLRYLDVRKPRLVLMDPFRNMWQGDENDSGAIIQVLGPVRKWAHLNEAAVIVVHHINKPPTQGPYEAGGMYSMRGSSAIPGLADGIVVIEPTRQEGQITIHTTFKRGAGWRRTVMLGVPGYGWPSQGYEVLPEQAVACEDLWRRSPVKDANLVQQLVQAAGNTPTMRSMLEALVRNQRIEMHPVEQRLFLGINSHPRRVS